MEKIQLSDQMPKHCRDPAKDSNGYYSQLWPGRSRTYYAVIPNISEQLNTNSQQYLNKFEIWANDNGFNVKKKLSKTVRVMFIPHKLYPTSTTIVLRRVN